ncbi:hypothetical protein [Novosphingobium sp.]|uniref:hypothetical protein n=1 Tax=Novosphingobium sp. TaxID=1874826 RepID=UPI002B481DA7|nr:hypothetical protein [Novosphingobium sp.]HKR91670.1 hypothetical protein [Novosphingobium sp.]
MSDSNGIPQGAALNGQGNAGSAYASDGAFAGHDGRTHNVVPIVLVSDLPEEALPDPKKFPLWVRALMLSIGTAFSWALVYALIYRI